MNKQPKLALRESCVHDLSRDWVPGRFVKMGAGTGHMASLFLARGFHGACHDLGADSRAMTRRRFADVGEAIRVVDTMSLLHDGEFDYLLAFEVLEHIEDHLDILRQWVQKLRLGGRVLVSVPAHASLDAPTNWSVMCAATNELSCIGCWKPPVSGRSVSSTTVFPSPN